MGKTYTCRICNSNFAKAGEMVLHVLTHESEFSKDSNSFQQENQIQTSPKTKSNEKKKSFMIEDILKDERSPV